MYETSRVRSVETALRQLLTNRGEILSSDSLEDIKAKIAQYFEKEKLLKARKHLVDDRLNFNWDGTKEFKEIANSHFKGDSKDALEFLYKESDELVKRLGDKTSASFSRVAGNIAELVQKYLGILPTWQKIISEKPDKYAKYGNELQRFLGSHGTVTECFLMKVMEKIEGSQAVEEFLNSLPNKNGFDYSEGFSVVLSIPKESKEPVIQIRYKDKYWEITLELIESIIEDKRKLMNP